MKADGALEVKAKLGVRDPTVRLCAVGHPFVSFVEWPTLMAQLFCILLNDWVQQWTKANSWYLSKIRRVGR